MRGAISELETVPVRARLSSVPAAHDLADQLLDEASLHGPAVLLSRSGMTLRLMKALAECMLAAELKHHLQRLDVHDTTLFGNYRNGSTPKTVSTTAGRLELAVPRVRFSTFVPQLVPRYQRRIPGFDHHIIVLYGRGLTIPELQAHLLSLYGQPAWSDLGGTLTREVQLHVRQWQTRRLESACELLYVDTLQAQRQPQGQAPLLFALGLRADGGKDVLGLWHATEAHPAPWHEAMRDLKGRGLLEPNLIAGERAQGLREAAALVYPAARFRVLR